ncbi:hypothetical protein SLEP1_g14840 [Rubroshorea leprosula]|uniref:Uncharacterized protein n=1 Tax=Rubroshorea leprosula TaxID=152421 RepID=A0AAV5ITD0_9ROSI|nr:hypothetical protein SLEP1_g14840 [Rubroshorea leprosula]
MKNYVSYQFSPSLEQVKQILEAIMAQGNSGRWSLQGTTTLVTGGTKGIEHAIVEEYWPDSGQPVCVPTSP